MSSDHETEKNLKEIKTKQFFKQSNEMFKPNLRTRTNIVNTYKPNPNKKTFPKPITNLNDKTPIKLKLSEDLSKITPTLQEFTTDEIEKKSMELRKDKPSYSYKDESPWTKFCKSDLSPLCKNNLMSPNKAIAQLPDHYSQTKMTNHLIEYQTPSPSLLKKNEMIDFSPFLNYTAKKVIQKLDFSTFDEKKGKNGQNTATNSVIVCFKSPTFNFLNKKYELEEDFIFSNRPKSSFEKNETISDLGDDDIIKLISKGPNTKENRERATHEVSQKHESYLKTMNKYKDANDLESNIPTTRKITPFITSNDIKMNVHEEINPKNLSMHSFYSTPKNNLNNNITKLNFKSPNENLDYHVKSLKNENKIEKNDCESQEGQENFSLPKKITCNCKKSRCLKLYCDCFAASEFCSKDCNCLNCSNVVENEDERYSSMMALMERNPLAFKPKYDKKEEIEEKAEILNNNEINDKIRHAKGCNCKKSNCLKKYCECYQAGIKCTDLCKCDTCKNHEGNGMMKKRKGNPFSENFNQYSDMKQESYLQTNSFTFGYNVANDNPRENVSFEQEENFSNENENLKGNGKIFGINSVSTGNFRTPKPKYENSGYKKKRNLAF